MKQENPYLAPNIEQEKYVPPKVRQLVSDLKAAGFKDRGGKGSHRNFTHLDVEKPVTLSGKAGDDAKPYQVKAVNKAIEESRE